MLRMKILICVLIIAVLVDILSYRIPNLWIGIGMAAGCVLTVADGGMILLGQTLLQVVIGFAVFYPFYLIKGLGAGDIKLFMMVGCYIRGASYLHCLLTAFLLAGIWAMLKMLWQQESRQRLYYLGRYCKKVAMTGVLDEYRVDKGNPKSVIRLSIPVLCSVLLWYGGLYS